MIGEKLGCFGAPVYGRRDPFLLDDETVFCGRTCCDHAAILDEFLDESPGELPCGLVNLIGDQTGMHSTVSDATKLKLGRSFSPDTCSESFHGSSLVSPK